MDNRDNVVRIVYASASKGGREIEETFLTKEKALADLRVNEYYLGCVIEQEVSEQEYQEILADDEYED